MNYEFKVFYISFIRKPELPFTTKVRAQEILRMTTYKNKILKILANYRTE